LETHETPESHLGAIGTNEIGDFQGRIGLRYCLVQATEDVSSNCHTADGSVRRRCIVVEVERLLVGKGSKLIEIFPSDIVVNGSVMDVSDINIVEDVVGGLESDLTGGEVTGEQRFEFIVKWLQLRL